MTPDEAGEMCDALDKSLRGAEMNLDGVASLIVTVIRDEAWRERKIRTGEIVCCASFLELLTAPPLRGYGEDPRKVEALLKDDAEALRMFREAITAPHGGDRKTEELSTKNYNVILDPPTKQGNSRAYTLDRLHREAPKLYAKVVAKKLSANAAAIEAGFRLRTITVPLDVDRAATAIRKHFTATQRARLCEALR